MAEPLEIERKWLIHYPNIEAMSQMVGFDYSEIEQTYTSHIEHNAYGRIRKRGKKGKYKYYKTFKTKISDLTHIEYEEEIDENEYLEIMKEKRQGYNTISKVRYVFDYQGFTYEVDVFPFWTDRAFMECEIESEDTQIPIPTCVDIIKEVTYDKRYRNSALAQSIITEDLEK
jgi:CYTH domain-containing protein